VSEKFKMRVKTPGILNKPNLLIVFKQDDNYTKRERVIAVNSHC